MGEEVEIHGAGNVEETIELATSPPNEEVEEGKSASPTDASRPTPEKDKEGEDNTPVTGVEDLNPDMLRSSSYPSDEGEVDPSTRDANEQKSDSIPMTDQQGDVPVSNQGDPPGNQDETPASKIIELSTDTSSLPQPAAPELEISEPAAPEPEISDPTPEPASATEAQGDTVVTEAQGGNVDPASAHVSASGDGGEKEENNEETTAAPEINAKKKISKPTIPPIAIPLNPFKPFV